MYEDDINEMADSVQNPDAMHDFLSTGTAVLIGAYIGHKIDQSRFGRRVNESPTFQAIFWIFKILMILLGVGLALFFVFFCLLPQF